jgi:hypothetical protein
LLSCGWLGYGEVLAHFLEFFGADAFDGKEVVDALEGAIGFAGVEDFLRGGGTDAGNLLVLRLMGWAGGFFLAKAAEPRDNARTRIKRKRARSY